MPVYFQRKELLKESLSQRQSQPNSLLAAAAEVRSIIIPLLGSQHHQPCSQRKPCKASTIISTLLDGERGITEACPTAEEGFSLYSEDYTAPFETLGPLPLISTQLLSVQNTNSIRPSSQRASQ